MTKKNILITGITGQDGAYLAKTLLDLGEFGEIPWVSNTALRSWESPKG